MIREAQLEDCEAIWQLVCTLEETELDHAAFATVFTEQQTDGRHVTLVWSEDADTGADAPIQALMNMRIEVQLHHAAKIAEVQELVVDPSLRGRGAGKELLTTACKAAREAGCVRIELVTNQRRHGAHRFYEHEGMHQTHYGYTLDL